MTLVLHSNDLMSFFYILYFYIPILYFAFIYVNIQSKFVNLSGMDSLKQITPGEDVCFLQKFRSKRR